MVQQVGRPSWIGLVFCEACTVLVALSFHQLEILVGFAQVEESRFWVAFFLVFRIHCADDKFGCHFYSFAAVRTV
jgi:hypothetical protein